MFMAAAEEIGVAEEVVVETTHPAKKRTRQRFRDSLQEHAATGSQPWTQGGKATLCCKSRSYSFHRAPHRQVLDLL